MQFEEAGLIRGTEEYEKRMEQKKDDSAAKRSNAESSDNK